MSSILDRLKEKLISYIDNQDSSSFVKKLKLVAEEIEEVKTSFTDIERVKDLDQAYGQTLDNYGSNVGERRKGNTDKLYRLLIRIKIAENTSDATLDYIVQALALALDRDEKEIYVEEGWNFINDEQPASIYVSFPSEVFNDYNITYDRFIQLFNSVVAAGVSTDFFVIEEDNINIAATMPYAEASTLPFCDTINTGQWTDQTTGSVYTSNVIGEYSIKDQDLPFLAGFFADDETLEYPKGVIYAMDVVEMYSNEDQELPFAGNLYSNNHEEFFNSGKLYATDIALETSRILYDKTFNYCNTFECGEVAV